MITFAIVTITYNAAHCLKRTVDSVMQQTYPHINHYIVDGKSKDDTVAMALEYQKASYLAANGHKVVVKSEADRGLYDAMNKGLSMANGDYIVFLNAGDFLPSADTIDTIISQAHLDDIPSRQWPGVIYGDTDIVDDQGMFLHKRTHRPPKQLSWRSFLHGMLVCHQAFYARLPMVAGIHYNLQYRYSADVDWCIRVMKEAARLRLPLANTHSVIACYTQEGQSTEHHRESLQERFHVMREHYGLPLTLVMHVWFVIRGVLRKWL